MTNESPSEFGFNGVDGASGEYLFPHWPLNFVNDAAQDLDHIDELKTLLSRSKTKVLPVVPGVDLNEINQTGWGIIFASDADPAIKDALRPLLDWRRGQAGEIEPTLYREFTGADGHRPGESKLEFLMRHGGGLGPPDPYNVPYYLLIVGDPERIPFRFQYQLDVQYAVGRLWFETLEEYANYALSVVNAERGKRRLPKRAVLFGVENQDDSATKLSVNELIKPLGTQIPPRLSRAHLDWTMETIVESTTKSHLLELLGGSRTPAVLFTSSHGVAFPRTDPRQPEYQGALLCQDWPGPNAWKGGLTRDHYVAAEDITGEANVAGLIAFHFACYSIGTPKMDDFALPGISTARQIAPGSFISQLPRRLLGHPQGGALAVIGHVDRACDYSFRYRGLGASLQAIRSTLEALLRGSTVGVAMEYINLRYAELATSAVMCPLEGSEEDPSGLEAVGLRTALQDSKNFVVLGDPAARACI